MQAIASRTPPAPSVWPIAAFIDETGIFPALLPKTSFIAAVS